MLINSPTPWCGGLHCKKLPRGRPTARMSEVTLSQNSGIFACGAQVKVKQGRVRRFSSPRPMAAFPTVYVRVAAAHPDRRPGEMFGAITVERA